MLILNTFIWSISITFLVFQLVYFYFKYVYTYWKRKGVPYLEPSFPFGNVKPTIDEKICFVEHLASIYKEIKSDGNNFGGFYAVAMPVFVPVNPELIKRMLVTDFQHFSDRGYYYDEENDPLTGNIGNLDGLKWKRLRSKVAPNYSAGKIKMLFQILLDCSVELDHVLRMCVMNKEPMDAGDVMCRLTIDNIGSCAFGINCNSLKNPEAEFHQYGNLFMKTTASNAKWGIFAILFPYLMKFFKIPLTNRKVTHFFVGAVRTTWDYRCQNNIQRNDFLDYFIKMKSQGLVVDDINDKKNEQTLTFNEIAAQAFIVFVAGYETSSTTLTFCLLELASNQLIQDQLRREILQVLKNHKNEITYEAIMDMTFMDRVLYETLRLYPPIALLNRECVKSYTIPDTNVTIDKGTACAFSLLGIHRDPEYYPDPDTFDPERFTEEEKSERHPFTYLPFGEGPRNCIGLKFGMMQMKVGLTKLLLHHKFHLHPKTPPRGSFNPKSFLLAPSGKVWLQVTDVNEPFVD